MSESFEKKITQQATTASTKLEGWRLGKIELFLGSLKEKLATAMESIKKMFWLELNMLESDVKKNNPDSILQNWNENAFRSWVERLQQQDFTDLMTYLAHQQGPGGISEIVTKAQQWAPAKSTIQYNMANNVDIPLFNKWFGTNINKGDKKTMQRLIRPHTFLLYRQKLYAQKKQTYISNTTYDHLIKPIAQKYNIPVDSVRVAIGIESTFEPRAWVKDNSTYIWLMQISPTIAKAYWYSPQDRLDPKKNIEMGVRYMAENQKTLAKLPLQQTYAMLNNPQQSTEKNLA